jgi:chaperonin cofactor prefoldin
MADADTAHKTGAMSGWSVNKSIPVTYIAAILFQTAVFLVVGTAWVTATNQRLQVLEDSHKHSLAIQTRLAVLESHNRTVDSQLASMAALLNSMMQRNSGK